MFNTKFENSKGFNSFYQFYDHAGNILKYPVAAYAAVYSDSWVKVPRICAWLEKQPSPIPYENIVAHFKKIAQETMITPPICAPEFRAMTQLLALLAPRVGAELMRSILPKVTDIENNVYGVCIGATGKEEAATVIKTLENAGFIVANCNKKLYSTKFLIWVTGASHITPSEDAFMYPDQMQSYWQNRLSKIQNSIINTKEPHSEKGPISFNLTSNPMKLRLISLNINSDRRLEKEWEADERYTHTVRAFGGLSIENRFPILEDFFLSQIKQKQTDCFALQEIDEKAKQLLDVFFKRQGFDIFFTQYCPHKDAYYYAFAYNPILYTAKPSKQIYFTQNGLPTSNEERAQLTKDEKMHRHLEQEFEKSAQVIQLMQVKTNKEIVLVNLQAGTVPNKHRELAMEKLGKELESESRPILLVGDFNQFDARVKESKIHSEQIDILKSHGFNWNSESILHSQTGIKSTFFAFPHDIERFLTAEDKQVLNAFKLKGDYEGMRFFYLDAITKNNIHLQSTCLDAVYDKNFPQHALIKTKPITQLAGETINTSKMNADTFQEKCIMGYRTFFSGNKEQNNKPPLPSDHFSLSVKVTF